MRIITRIWSSLGFLAAGYVLTVGLTAYRATDVDRFLTELETATVPNVNHAHAAFASIRQMSAAFQDSVVFSEPNSVERGAQAGHDTCTALAMIRSSHAWDPHIPEQAADLQQHVQAFLDHAVPLYRRLSESTSDPLLLPEAARAKNKMESLTKRITDLELATHDSVKRQIELRREQNYTDRQVSQAVMIVVLLATITLTSTIIFSLSKRLQRLEHANARLQAGDYEAQIRDDSRDEIGQLARGFDTMRSAIVARTVELQRFNASLDDLVKTRTEELEIRNQELSTQVQERQRAEHSLRLIESAIAQVDDGVMIVRNTALQDLTPEYVNAAFQRVLGLESGEIPSGLLIRALFTSAGRRLPLERAWSSAQEGQQHSVELVAETSDQRQLFSEWSIAPMRDGGGSITNLIIILRDLTERKHQEAQRQQGQKMESVGQLAAGIAHEINTPIQFIGDNLRFLGDSFADLTQVHTSFSSLLAAARGGSVPGSVITQVDADLKRADLAYLEEEIPKSIAQSLDGVTRVAEIVRAMKEFSHPDLGEKKLTDVNKAIQTTVTVARNEYKYVADLITELAPDLPAVPCIVGEFNQVILNLVVNAAHAIADVVAVRGGRGTITISTTCDGEYVRITVADTGTGIPESARKKVFDPFFTTKAVGKGTGQGLYIAHTVIVKKHGGRLHFETELGAGTTFVIQLPITTSPLAVASAEVM